MVAVQQREEAEDELCAARERGADLAELKRLQGRVSELAREVAEREEAMHVAANQHCSESAAAAHVSPHAGEAEAGAGASCDTTAPTPPTSEEALPAHAAATPSVDSSRLPKGSVACELLEKQAATRVGAPAATDAEEDADEADDEGAGIKIMPPATDFGAFPDRPHNQLEALYARTMAGKKVNKHDRNILRSCCELRYAKRALHRLQRALHYPQKERVVST
jgi:hypothetical protein